MRARLVFGAVAAAALALGCDSSPTAPGPPATTCSYQLATPGRTFGAGGGTATISVTTTAQCTWTAQAEAGWITIVSGASGTGPGSVDVTVAANPDPSGREGSVRVADQTMRLTQEGREACAYTVTVLSHRVGPSGGSGNITVETTTSCAWSATSSVAWLTLAPEEGSGSATVRYTAAPWSGTVKRTAQITVAGRDIVITQDPDLSACNYTVNPLEFTLHWHHTGGDINVSALDGCPWTVSAGTSWLSVSGPRDREGSDTARFTNSTYTSETTRKGAIELRWPTATAGQNVWVTQEGCRYALTETSRSFPAAESTGYVDVFGDPVSTACPIGCPWTGEPSVDWIQITSGSPNSGDNRLYYRVLENKTGVFRTGVIRIAGLTLTITQTP